ncbi:MAG: EF-hand domain-containing protein [Methylocystis sp.]
MRAGALAFAVIAALGSAAGFAPKVFAQQADEPLVATASEWGGQGGVYTCDQWRAYVTRMYRLGDPRHRGYIEAKDFEIIKKASPVFQMATFDYFDMAGKGRVTQKEFIEFESPFFARFDKKHTCRVTGEDIRAANAPAQTQTQAPRQHGGRGGMDGGGNGGGYGGLTGGGGFGSR